MAKPKEALKEQTEETAVAVADKPTTAIANVNSDMMSMLKSNAGMGQENVTEDDLIIPRLGIIQSLSPQRSKTKPEFIEGAEEGMIFVNSGQLFSGNEGVVILPVHFRKVYLEWAPRESGGGLINNYGQDATVYNSTPSNDKGKRVTKDGNLIQPTAEYFVFIVDLKTGQVVKSILSMASTFMRYAKKWNVMINNLLIEDDEGDSFNPPSFYQPYRLKTVIESNNQGEWFRWDITAEQIGDRAMNIFDLPKGDEIYKQAVKFHSDIHNDNIKVSAHESDAAGQSEGDEDPM